MSGVVVTTDGERTAFTNPHPQELTQLLAAAFGAVEVLARRPNPYASTFAGEVVTVRFPDGRESEVLVKSVADGAARKARLEQRLSYESEVYRAVLEPLQTPAPRCYGRLRNGSLVLEHLAGAATISCSGQQAAALAQAAAWIGEFHRANAERRREPQLGFLHRYDRTYFLRWSTRALRIAAGRSLPWLEAMCCEYEAAAPCLLRANPTVIHGEYYPENILCAEGAVHPVDWESAAVAAGEIDLATLTERWPPEIVKSCESHYREARWPEGAPPEHASALRMARIYRYLRWLYHRPDWDVLERLAQQANVI